MILCEILNVNKYVESVEEWESVYHHSLVSLPKYHPCYRLQYTIICHTALSMEESIDSRGNSLENGVSLETTRIQILRTMSPAMEDWSLGESRNWSWNEKETIMVILFSAIF